MAINFKTLGDSNKCLDFEKAAASLHKRANSLQLDIHLYLFAVAARWSRTGDIRPAVKNTNLLLNEMPGGVRANAVRAWVETFFGFVFSEETGEFAGGEVKAKDLDLSTIANNRWWEFKPEAPYKPMDFEKQVLSVVKKASDRLKKGVKEDDAIVEDRVRAVEDAVMGRAPQIDLATMSADDLATLAKAVDEARKAKIAAASEAVREAA